ncbi:hypothetical protein CS0771_18020 [Catellatospora sp. IY07-71]|uniref:DUF4383 domain-containing protein n=1 Tax=Catellatospora sp. IY07-71 TaxID=2728827 RepID=UPI001BB34206|nr:DUF4383 domain-containing protein [Catellatospora sp. IY07-71]BCJ72258.1 hypothetical protein CS0771_18020 [Catellatospora sp. IY07-71]
MHLPVNHRLRPQWRFLAGLCGAYLLVFGIVGAVRSAGEPFFSRADTDALGLKTNPAFAWLSIIVGAVVLGGAFIGRNIDHWINMIGGAVFLLAGLFMLLLMQTPANKLNFEVATTVVSFIIGTILLIAGMYGKVGTPAEAIAEEVLRHSTRPGDKFAVKPHANK